MEDFQHIENWEELRSFSGRPNLDGEQNQEQYQEGIEEIQALKDKDQKKRVGELKAKMAKLNEDSEKKEKVREFIRDNCSEPIAGIDRIVPYKDLVEMLVKWAEDEWKEDVKKSILESNPKDKRIYELKVYKDLIEKWFILPSDNRSYKGEQYHLWVDYNVRAWFEVRSIYNWEVVASWLDWWLWHRVIIRHSMPDGTNFYSLYAHLGPDQLPEEGKNIKIWDIIGRVWAPFTEENWDWEEHLHFQIMEKEESPKWYSEIDWEWNYDVLKSFGRE